MDNKRKETNQYIISSDGGLEIYSDPFKNITPSDAEMAEKTELAIIGTKQDIERNFLKLAYLIDIFDSHNLYKGRGYETMRSWSESPEIELSWRVVTDLLRVRREVVPILTEQVGSEEQAQEVLITAGVSKARAVLPLLRDEGGEEMVVDLVERAPQMTWNDVRNEVKKLRGIEQPIDSRFPAMFTARVKQGDEFSRVEVSVTDGGTTERCGVLTIRNRYMPRFEDRFGQMLQFEKD